MSLGYVASRSRIHRDRRGIVGVLVVVSGTSAILTFPEAAWELSLGIYLIAKDFRSDATLFTRPRRDPTTEHRTLGARQTLTPDGAAATAI